MAHVIYGHSIVVQAEGQVSCDLAEEVAILDVKHGKYYGLNAIGAQVWHLIQEPKTVNEVGAALLEDYDVEPERCEHDLLACLRDLAERGLIEVKDETGP